MVRPVPGVCHCVGSRAAGSAFRRFRGVDSLGVVVTKPSPVVRLLRDLLAVPSVNPAFLPPDDPRTGEQAMAEAIADRAARAGLEVQLDPVAPGRPNVLVRLRPSGRIRHRILLAPHLDTVGEPGLDALLTPRLVDGRLVGRGACDTKGCVAAMLQAVLDVAASGRRPESTEIVFAGLVDEENAQLGSRHLGRHGPRADLAVVGEPTRLQVVTAHKGDLWLQLRTRGRAAHGATPERGRNAVHAMARALVALERDYIPGLARLRHPLLGSPTLNVGSIRGGQQPNIVPDECVVTLDRRTLPGEKAATVRRDMMAVVRAAGVRAVFDDLRITPCEPLETDPDHPWVRRFLSAAGRTHPVGVHYFCDAAVLAAAGTPALEFGPGDIAQAHTDDEWIRVASLERGLAILGRFLRDLP